MLAPKKIKYRKQHKGGKLRGTTKAGASLSFGEYGLLTLEQSRITNRQIEAARVAITRAMKRRGKLWIRIFPDTPLTRKPAETRMGKGKGSPEEWVAKVKPGRLLYEVDGVTEEVAREAFIRASAKLPVKTKIVCRRDEP